MTQSSKINSSVAGPKPACFLFPGQPLYTSPR
jgi:hypothetical protein